MNNCVESQTRICKAYISDCYSRLASSLNGCASVDQQILKSNILNMLDRVKLLIIKKEVQSEVNSVDEAENK